MITPPTPVRSALWSLIVLLVTTGLMIFLASYPFPTSSAGNTPLALGFLLLGAWCFGLIAERLHLPRLTGYILAGIVAGPEVSGFVTGETISELRLVDDLVLTFIALVAGSELRLARMRERLHGIACWIAGQTLITPLVVGLGVILGARFIPGANASPAAAVAVALVLGALSLARSPAATVVVIEESKAKGPFTDTTLATTVALDTIVIMLFAAAVTVAEALTAPGDGFQLGAIIGLGADLFLSALVGALVGLLVIAALRVFDIDLPVLLAAIAFLITQLSRELSHLLADVYGGEAHLEPLLMGLTAGIVAQNLSKLGESFTESLERIAPPIFVAFFALAGASLRISALATTWPLALMLVVLRGAGLFGGGYLGSVLARDPRSWRSWSGLTSIAQAGVSLGLVAEIGRRFPDWGAELVSPLVAAIAINQVAGPILLARALGNAGESHEEDPDAVEEKSASPAS